MSMKLFSYEVHHIDVRWLAQQLLEFPFLSIQYKQNWEWISRKNHIIDVFG